MHINNNLTRPNLTRSIDESDYPTHVQLWDALCHISSNFCRLWCQVMNMGRI